MKIVKRETRSKSKAHQALTGALHEAKTEPKTEETSAGKGKPRSSNRAFIKVEKEAVQQQQSYIMKLFDRSVNLAKFDESTPLYPIIRDWLKNAPRQKPSNDANDQDQDMDLKDDEVGHMPIVELKENIVKFKKEKIDPDLKSIDELDSENPKITKEELLEEHKRKWSKIRENWLENNKKFKAENFENNIKILESLKKNL